MLKTPDVFSIVFSDDLQKGILHASGMVAVASLGSYIAGKAYSSITKKDYESPQSIYESPQSASIEARNASKPENDFDRAMDLKNKGNGFFRDKNYNDAILCYTEAIQLCPANQNLDLASFYQNRAAAFEMLEQYEKVVDDCTESLKFNKKYTKAIRRRALSAEKLGLYQMAVLDYATICFLEDLYDFEMIDAHDRVLKLLGRQLTDDYLANRGDKMVPLSISFVSDSLSFYTTDPIINRVHFNGNGVGNAHGDSQELKGYERAKSCLISKQYAEIIQACTEELKINESPFLVESLLLRGTFYIFCGAFNKADDDLNRVLSLLNDTNEGEFSSALKCNAHLKLAVMHQLAESFTQCAECLNEAERINSNNPDIFLQRGTMFTAQNEFIKAQKEFAKAVRLKPNCPYYNVHQISSEFKIAGVNEDGLGLRKCLDDFKRLAERFPDCAEVQSAYGIALFETNQFLIGVDYLEKALKLDPINAVFLAQLGTLDVQQKNVDTGLRRIERALELDPHCLPALKASAFYYSTRLEVTKSLEFFERALKVSRCRAELFEVMIMRETTLTQIKLAAFIS